MQKRIFLYSLSIVLLVGFFNRALASDFTLVNQATFLTEYYSRGITQTRELPAPQFETTLFHKSGFFAGIFISRVEFLDNDEADVELDYYLAYGGKYGKWSYRLGGIYFTFPNADSSLDYDFFEADLGLGYQFDPVYVEASLRVSPDHFASSGIERYFKLQSILPIQENLKLKKHLAHRYIEENDTFFNIPDAFDWEIGVEYTPIEKTDLILKYVDSSFSENECLFKGYCEERLIAGIRRSF